MTNEEAIEFMTLFDTADSKDRMSRNMCQCPVFLKRSWQLGQARLAKLKDKILPEDQVKKVLQSQKPKALRFECFAASVATWRSLRTAQMSAVQLQQAKAAWQEGQDAFLDLQKTRSVEERDVLQNMLSHMRDHLKWKMAHLHDACVSIGSCPPSDVNFISYFRILHRQCHSANLAWQPQNAKTHVKASYVRVIQFLQQGARSLGGVSGSKQILAERLAKVLDTVIQAGRQGDTLQQLQAEIEKLLGKPVPTPPDAIPKKSKILMRKG
jgi:hypothetical protein